VPFSLVLSDDIDVATEVLPTNPGSFP